MKTKSLILIFIFVLFSVFLFGCSVDNKDNSDSATNTDSSSTLTTENIKEPTENTDEADEYPFDAYQSFLANSSGKIVDRVNNNPIDKMYYEKYINTKSLDEEQQILVDWAKAYETELENAVDVFNSIVKQKSYPDSNISSSELLAIMDEYYDNCSEYTESTAQLAYGVEEFSLGNGTSHRYDLLLNSLKLNRTNTLRVVECIYLLGNDYDWIIED